MARRGGKDAAAADARELQPLHEAPGKAKDERANGAEAAEARSLLGTSGVAVKVVPAKEAQPHRKIKNEKKKKIKEEYDPTQGKSGIVSLFRFATRCDLLILSVGLIFATAHGASLPALALVFGQMTNTFIQQFKKDNYDDFPVEDTFLSNFSSTGNETDNSTRSENLEHLKDTMSQFSLYYLYIGIAVLIASFIQTLCWELACERQVYRMRQRYFAQMLRQDISWYDQNQSGDLTVKLADDMERIREGIGCKFSMVLQYIATFFSGLGVGLYANWQLTLVILGVSPLLIGTSGYLAKIAASSAAREQLKYSLAGGIAEEVLTNIRTVAAFGGQLKATLAYEKGLDEGRILAMKKYYVLAAGIGLVFFITYGSYGLAFWYGSQMIGNGDATPGSVFTVFFSVMAGAFSLGNALPFVNAVSTAVGAASTVFAVIDRIPDIDSYDKKGTKPQKVKGHIEFQKVTFKYLTRPEIKVLKEFNVDINPGQTVALVGSSGAGKSTIVGLLLRFYNISSGNILLDGVDIQTLNLEWLRSQIGVVSQEPVLFGVSILDNIMYGHDNVSFDAVVKAAKLANAHEFITSMPEGYNTMVGSCGAQLSGGQKQRIAIARALVRNPKILLLDEATSALDAQSEGVVQSALENAMEGRTTIVIAHRLSTIRNANIIYALKDGSIVEQGTHEELLMKQGLYYSLVQAQSFHDIDEDSEHGDELSESLNEADKRSNRKATSITSIAVSLGNDTELNKKMELESVSADDANMARLFKLNSPEWFPLLLGCLGCMATGAVMPVFAYFYGEVFATFTLRGEALYEAARFWSGMFCVLAVASGFSFWLQCTFMTTAAEKLVMRLRLKAFQNILNQAVGWFDMETSSPGRLITRLARDAPLIKSASGLRAGQMLTATVTLAAALAIAFCHGWKLALLLLAAVPVLAGASYQQMMVLRRTQRRDAELMEEAGKVASESVQNIRTVQALGKESLFVTLYMQRLIEPYKEAKKQAHIYAVVFSFSQTVIYLMYAGAFRFGAYLIEIEDMEPTNVYRVFFALAFCAASIGQTSAYLQDYTKAKMAAALIFQLMDRVTDISISPILGIKPTISGNVRFRNVQFRYPNRPDVSVLSGLNLSVQTGKTLALVGPSGCGKSTVVSLLERFYDPTAGIVEVDGFDIKTFNLPYLRKHIGLVTQEPTLFDCSIWENIAYGLICDDPNLDSEKVMPMIIHAARGANIHEFISSLPSGYDTKVGEKGTQLSGGQKQRIAIARALIRDPKILLLDEATSALDTESEKIVQEALDKARQGRTSIVIAHRLSTIQNADSIAVIHQGSVAEQGSHEELMALKGKYYLLVQRQTL